MKRATVRRRDEAEVVSFAWGQLIWSASAALGNSGSRHGSQEEIIRLLSDPAVFGSEDVPGYVPEYDPGAGPVDRVETHVPERLSGLTNLKATASSLKMAAPMFLLTSVLSLVTASRLWQKASRLNSPSRKARKARKRRTLLLFSC